MPPVVVLSSATSRSPCLSLLEGLLWKTPLSLSSGPPWWAPLCSPPWWAVAVEVVLDILRRSCGLSVLPLLLLVLRLRILSRKEGVVVDEGDAAVIDVDEVVVVAALSSGTAPSVSAIPLLLR